MTITGIGPMSVETKAFVSNSRTTERERLRNHFLEQGQLNENGDWTGEILSEYPPLDPAAHDRVKTVFSDPYLIVQRVGRSDTTVRSIVTLADFCDLFPGWTIQVIGSGAGWGAGKEFFKGVLSKQKVPDKLLTLELFQWTGDLPRDFDIRLWPPVKDESAVRLGYESIFRFLASFTGESPGRLMKSYEGAWFYKPHHPDKYGIVPLTFYRIPRDATSPLVRAFQGELMPVYEIGRMHLQEADSCQLVVEKYRPKIRCRLTWSSGSLPEEYVAHVVTGTIKIKKPEKVKKAGLSALIVKTIKRGFPAAPDLFPELYKALLRMRISFSKELVKATRVHAPGQSFGLFYAAFNAFTFIGESAWNDTFSALKDAFQKIGAGSSFSDKLFRFAVIDPAYIAQLQSLLNVHAAIGFEKRVSVFEKDRGRFVELHCIDRRKNHPSVLFFRNDLSSAIESLCNERIWATVGDLSDSLLQRTPVDGIDLTEDCREKIERLFSIDSPEAKNLSFILLLKWHMQFPSDTTVELLLIRFPAFPAYGKRETRSGAVKLFFDRLHKFSGTFPSETIESIRNRVESCKRAVGTVEWAEILYHTSDPRLKKVAFKHLLSEEWCDSKEPLRWLEHSAEKAPESTLRYFFEIAFFYKPWDSWPAFLKIVGSLPGEGDFSRENETARTYLSSVILGGLNISVQKNFPKIRGALQQLGFDAKEPLLENVDKHFPDLQKRIFESVKKEILQEKRLKRAKVLFTFFLIGDSFFWDEEEVQKTGLELLEKLAGRNEIGQALRLFFLPEFQCRCLVDKTIMIRIFRNAFDRNRSVRIGERLQILLALSKVLVMAPPECADFPEGTDLLISGLNGCILQLEPVHRRSVREAVERLISRIGSMYPDLCVQLLHLCQLAGVEARVDFETVRIIFDRILTSEETAHDSVFVASENVYRMLLRKSMPSIPEEYADKGAQLFIEAYTKKKNFPKILQWAAYASTYHPCLLQAAELLFSNHRYPEHEAFLLLTERRFSDRIILYREWRKRTGKGILSASERADVYIKKFELFKEQPREDFIDEVIETAGELIRSPSSKERDLALELTICHSISDPDLWESIIQSLSACPSKKRIVHAWDMLHVHCSEAHVSTRLALVRRFRLVGFSSSSLLPLLSDKKFEESSYGRGSSEEKREMRRHLFFNALACIEAKNAENPEEDSGIEYSELNEFRKKHASDYSESDFIEKWPEITSVKGMLACLNSVQAVETAGRHTISPSLQLFEHLRAVFFPKSKKPTADKDSIPYEYIFHLLETEKWKEHVSIPRFNELLLKILRRCFIEERPKDGGFMYSCFKCINPRFESLLPGMKGGLYEKIIGCYCLLLGTCPSDELRSFHENIADKVILKECKLPLTDPKKKRFVQSRGNVLFVDSILKMAAVKKESVPFLLDILHRHIEFLLENFAFFPETVKNIFKIFVHSGLFSSETVVREDGSIEVTNPGIEQRHFEVSRQLVKIACRSDTGLLADDMMEIVKYQFLFSDDLNKTIDSMAAVYANNTRHAVPPQMIGLCGTSILNEYLLQGPFEKNRRLTLFAMDHAYRIFHGTRDYLIFSPVEIIPTIVDYLPMTAGSNAPIARKIEWMEDAGCLMKQAIDQRSLLSVSPAVYEAWRGEIASGLIAYFDAVGTVVNEVSDLEAKRLYVSTLFMFGKITSLKLMKIDFTPFEKIALQVLRVACRYEKLTPTKRPVALAVLSTLATIVGNSWKSNWNRSMDLLFEQSSEHRLEWLFGEWKVEDLSCPPLPAEENAGLNRLRVFGRILLELESRKVFAGNPGYFEVCFEKFRDCFLSFPTLASTQLFFLLRETDNRRDRIEVAKAIGLWLESPR